MAERRRGDVNYKEHWLKNLPPVARHGATLSTTTWVGDGPFVSSAVIQEQSTLQLQSRLKLGPRNTVIVSVETC